MVWKDTEPGRPPAGLEACLVCFVFDNKEHFSAPISHPDIWIPLKHKTVQKGQDLPRFCFLSASAISVCASVSFSDEKDEERVFCLFGFGLTPFLKKIYLFIMYTIFCKHVCTHTPEEGIRSQDRWL